MKKKVFKPFIKAVFEMDFPKFRELLETCEFDRELLTDTKLCSGQAIPIYWLTQCWEIILENPEEWTEDARENVKQKKEANQKIKEIFRERFNVEFLPIDFHNLDEEAIPFFRADKADSDDDVLWEDKNELKRQGFREIDLDLYCAVCRFDYGKVEKLLKTGANPCLSGTEYDCIDRITTESSYISIDQYGYIDNTRKLHRLSRYQWKDTVDLIGWAAHETMYSLLKNTTENHA